MRKSHTLMAMLVAAAIAAPAVPAEGDRLIEFTVLDEATREPLSGVSLESSLYTGSENTKGEYQTDETGRCAIPLPPEDPDHFRVNLKREGRVPLQATWRNAEQLDPIPAEFEVLMEKGTQIGGIIRDEEGNPVEGAKVNLLVPSDNKGRVRPAIWDHVETTGPDGRWVCGIMPSDLEDVWIRLAHPDFIDDNMYGATPKPPMEQLRDLSGVMVMKKGFAFGGVVLGPDGGPVENAKVAQGSDRWGSHYPETRTDAEGRFEFGGASEGGMVLTVQAEGLAPWLGEIAVRPGMDPLGIEMKKGEILRGKVVDADGEPLEGVTIVADTWRGHRSVEWRAETGTDGAFEWPNAPGDEVLFDILKRDFMSVRKHPMQPRDDEHTVTLYPELTVSGTVVDAETGEPLPGFNVIRGILWDENREHWERRNIVRGVDGRYEVMFDYPRYGHLVRIEAEGYMPAVSRKFANDEGAQTWNFEMEKGSGPAARIVSADGEPVEGLKVILCTASEGGYIQNGERSVNDSPQTETDDNGAFSFPPQDGNSIVFAYGEAGYVQSSGDELKANANLVLQPWASVEGVVFVGSKPAENERVSLHLNEPYNPDQPRIHFDYNALTDADGRFSFNRVISATFSVARMVETTPVAGFGGGRSFSTAAREEVHVSPGETASVKIGGTGRPVVGRIEPEPGLDVHLDASRADIATRQPQPPFDQAELREMTREKIQALYEKWMQSPEMRNHQRKRYLAVIEPDGTFRADDVESGTYTLSVTFHAPPAANQCGLGEDVARLTHEFHVPGIPGGQSDKPFDIGSVALKREHMITYLEEGAPAPAFSAETLGGETVTLESLRGKVVLLDFWATWCGPCVQELPHLQSLYEQYGGNDKFAMISLSLDNQKEDLESFLKDNKMEWTQCFLGSFNETELPGKYGVKGIPSIFLIGPDGKLIKKGLRGAAIEPAAGAALANLDN